MKKRSLLSLIVPIFALSGCSYRGDYKPLRDGNLLFAESFIVRDDSFKIVDQHIKANDTFCIYFSLEGCSACERFLLGFKEVVEENKVLTFHLEAPQKADDIVALYEAYPDFKTDYSPSFFIVDQGKIESIPYDKINSESRLRNTLKRKISLVDNYFFESEIVDFQEALEKANLQEATVIELDFASANQINQYKIAKSQVEGPLFVHQKDGLLDIRISKVSK